MFIMRGSGKNDQVQGPEDSIGKIQGCCNIHNFPSVSLVHLRRRIDLLYVRNRANMSLPKGKTKKTEDTNMTRFEKDVKEMKSRCLKEERQNLRNLKEKADAKRTDLKDSALHRSMKEKWQSTKNWMP